MVSILRQKYEKLVDYIDMMVTVCGRNCGHLEISYDELGELEEMIKDIRTIQKFLRVEDRT